MTVILSFVFTCVWYFDVLKSITNNLYLSKCLQSLIDDARENKTIESNTFLDDKKNITFLRLE